MSYIAAVASKHSKAWCQPPPLHHSILTPPLLHPSTHSHLVLVLKCILNCRPAFFFLQSFIDYVSSSSNLQLPSLHTSTLTLHPHIPLSILTLHTSHFTLHTPPSHSTLHPHPPPFTLHPCPPQDWFNSCLKQTVMDLASHSQLGGVAEGVVSPTETTDGAGMSRRGLELDEDAIDQARQALDLEE